VCSGRLQSSKLNANRRKADGCRSQYQQLLRPLYQFNNPQILFSKTDLPNHSLKKKKGRKMAKRIKKILVACDCSDFSIQIFAYAVEIATGLEAALTVVNVINQIEVDRMARTVDTYSGHSVDDYVKSLKADRHDVIKSLIQDTGHPELFSKTVIKIGTHHEVLMEVIKQEQSDLLIMGNKGRGNLAGILLGSCAEKMFRNCPVAVLMVRVSNG
jgi:nucleotide-binding universal stress UspA family protein